ncbi:MAG TPA: hypothetical protein VGL53_27325 [Bryobacteraceae bacterium]|jgi:glucuronoarabinoxylan endo-1,4-beta-xylanase
MAGKCVLVLLAAASAMRADQVLIKSVANGQYIGRAADGVTLSVGAATAETFEMLYPGTGYFILQTESNGAYVAFADQQTPAASAHTPHDASLLAASAPRASDQAISLQLHATGLFLAVSADGSLSATALAASDNSEWFTIETVKATPAWISIDFGDPRQRIEGFGAAVAYYANWLTAHPYKQEIYNALFDPANGLGMSVLRVQNIFRYPATPNFDPDVPQIVNAAAAIQGSPIAIEMSSWTPPASLKSNQSENCANTLNCTLAASASGGFNYSGFASYWTDSLAAYASVGVNPKWISLQNEPDWIASYASCRFDPTEDVVGGVHYAGYNKALDAVSQALGQIASPPVIIGPEVLGIGYNDVPNYMLQLNAAEIGAVAHHLYHGGSETAPDSFNPIFESMRTGYASSPRFMTEFGDGVSSTANAGTGFETAWLIHNSLAVEEVSLYAYWGAIWPDQYNLVYVDNPFISQSQWTAPHGWKANDYYYALEHFSRFIRPGFVRFTAWTNQAGLRVSAYQNTGATGPLSGGGISPVLASAGPCRGCEARRTVVIVALNTSTGTSIDTAIEFKGIAGSKSSVYRTNFGGTSERFASIGPLDAGNSVTIPPQGAVTVVLQPARIAR